MVEKESFYFLSLFDGIRGGYLSHIKYKTGTTVPIILLRGSFRFHCLSDFNRLIEKSESNEKEIFYLVTGWTARIEL